MVVPDSFVEIARAVCGTLAGSGGSGMFTTPLSNNGELPITFWISSGLIEQDFADLLPTKEFDEESNTFSVKFYDPSNLKTICEVNGVTYSDIEELILFSDISAQSAEQVLERLGLKLVTQQV